MLKLASSSFGDFNMTHCFEMLQRLHGLSVSYLSFRGWCRAAGIGKRKRRRARKKRMYRERLANEGLLLQMDGSHHKWNGQDEWVLIAAVDDACDELEVRDIFANSAQAKGRIERTWQAFQDRLIPELRINGIKALGAANEYFQNHFIPKYWLELNTVTARDPQSRYRHLPRGINFDDVFCMSTNARSGGITQ